MTLRGAPLWSDPHSDIVSDISSGRRYSIYVLTCSLGILSEILFWQAIRHLTSYLASILASLLAFSLAICLAFFLIISLASFLTLFPASLLALYLESYLTV